MKSHDTRIQTIQNQFDCYCKKVIRFQARNHYAQNSQRRKRGISFEEIEGYLRLESMKDPFSMECFFKVLDYDILVRDSSIASALDELPKKKRDIILLHYYLDMSDGSIADRLGMARRTVQYQRTRALKEMKALLGSDCFE